MLPLTEPVLVFAVATLLFLVAPLLFQRMRLPGLVGLIAAGAAAGPTGLGLLERDEAMVLLGTVGLLYLMLMAGVEIDLQGFSRHRRESLAFGAVTFLLPQVLGTGVGLLLGYGWVASILLASMFASHTLIGYPIASRLGITRNRAVTAAVGGTMVTDVAALLVLAVVAASRVGELDLWFWVRLGLSVAVFAALVTFGLPRVAAWFFRRWEEPDTAGYLFVLAGLFVSASLAHLAGVEPLVGAFLAGLALNRFIPEGSPLGNRVQFFGNAFFVPFFLFSVGMLVDLRVLGGSLQAWKVMVGMTAAVVLTKWAAAKLTQRIFGYSAAEGWTIFGLSVAQAAATLAAALVGYRIDMFDAAVLNGSIMMIVTTCVIGPAVVERFGRQVALEEEETPYEPAEAPQRIVVPITDLEGSSPLIELALLFRDPASPEPLLPLAVTWAENGDSGERIAAAEAVLSEAVAHGASAAVPVIPMTRLDRDPVSGILRGLAECRGSTIVLRWQGEPRGRRTVFGPVLDPLVEKTDQLLVAARLRVPVNTTRRVVLVLCPNAHRSRGFHGAVVTVKTIAARLGVPILALPIEEGTGVQRERLEEIPPEVKLELQGLQNWGELSGEVQALVEEEDLVVVFSARRASIVWTRSLDALPREMARIVPGNLLFLYPAEIGPDAADARTAASRQLPAAS